MGLFDNPDNGDEPIAPTRVTGSEIVETLLQMGLLRREDRDSGALSPPSLDMRAYRRFYAFRVDPFTIVTQYDTPDAVVLPAKGINVSHGGICFVLERSLEIGELFRLDFAFPAQPVHFLIGSVRHCAPKEGEGYVVGAGFV